jgi:FkbM family methyltransferase
VSELAVRLGNGTTLIVPASLESITTYVLLEQEGWFEKEMAFVARWLKPGMTAIDIGANLGVYSLAMADRVGPAGQVFAIEPASASRELLLRSRALNRADNLAVIGVALSDDDRTGFLAFGASSELNALSAARGPGESVPVTSLDRLGAKLGWSAPDFVKIDAEGEEERILAGAGDFFARHSPLVLFEIKAGDAVNERLRAAFPAMGYRLYRQLGGEPVLVPLAAAAPLDGYELNLFAAKPDRAAALAAEGLLVETTTKRPFSEATAVTASDLFVNDRPGIAFGATLAASIALDPTYREALRAYAKWRTHDQPLAERVTALEASGEILAHLCQRAATPARLSTCARVSAEAGRRETAVAALTAIVEAARRRPPHMDEPSWPACPRYDGLDPAGREAEWFIASAIEQLERTRSFSARFAGINPDLPWLCGRSFASAEMERRLVLHGLYCGEPMTIPERLCHAAPDHLNAELWRGGQVAALRIQR